MKKILLALIFLTGISNAHALHCSMAKENPEKPGTYDQVLFNTVEVLRGGAKQEILVVNNDGSLVRNFTRDYVNTRERASLIQNAIIVVVIRNADNSLVLGSGYLDITQTDNMLRSPAIASSPDGRYLFLLNSVNKTALTCANIL